MLSAFDPILYFVTPEIGDNIEEWEFIVREAIHGGVRMIQIRDKESSAQKIVTAAQRVRPLLKNFNVSLLINDRADLAYVIKADGVHLGQSDLKVSEARSILGNRVIIGLSVGTFDQAVEAENEQVSYLAASPVFACTTKTDCGPPWELDGLKHLCAMSCHPIIAIGGINGDNIEAVLESGVAGVAVVSAISKAPYPQTAAREMTNKMRKYVNSRLG